MEVIREDDGFNVVFIQCDGCEQEIPQVRHARGNWFEVTISPLARDKWNSGDDYGNYHFCSTECFSGTMDSVNPIPAAEEEPQ